MCFLCLLPFLLAAVMCDLRSRRIPNELVAGGLILGGAYQWSVRGLGGVGIFLQGALVPLVALGLLHAFRLIGAGDVKLLMMAGGFLGPGGSVKCILCSFLAAGALALPALRKRGLLAQRMRYLAEYVRHYRQGGAWSPYIAPGENAAYVHFSIPVLVGSFLVMGGWV